MLAKRLLCTQRLRRVPKQFGWIDTRLVRDKHIARRSPTALALYLFLVVVADAQGLSYYADLTLAALLSLDPGSLRKARHELLEAQLIVYEKPLYQVLSLDPPLVPPQRSPCPQPQRIGQILPGLLGGPTP